MEKENLLQNLKANLINWYDFKSTDSIWVLGKVDDKIIEFLRLKFKNVETDENTVNTNFDYILVINYFDEEISDQEIKNEINEKAKFLNENGEILLVFKNRLGAKEIANKSFEGFSKNRILNLIADFKYKFYYMLPSEDYVNIIFTDNYLPTSVDIGRNINFSEILTDAGTIENKILNKILKGYNRDFETCANAYFVEISKKEIIDETKAVFFSNIRNDKYSIRTKLLKNVAIKEAVNEKSIEHIKRVQKNIDILNKRGIKTLDTYEENKIISKLALNAEKLDERILKYYQDGDNKYINEILKFENDIMSKLEKNDSKDNVFEKYDIPIPKELISEMNFVKDGLWDLTFRNIIIVDDEYYVYDQEWYEENIPIEFILFRSILHLENIGNSEKMRLFEELNLEKYYVYFYKLEQCLGKDVTNFQKLELYGRALDSENKNIEFQKELTKSKELINSDLEIKYRDVLNNYNDLSDELKQKKAQLNELQLSIANSKTLGSTRSIKDKMKSTKGFCLKIFRTPVKFVWKKIAPKKIRRKLKTKIQYSNRLAKIAGIPTFYQYNHDIKSYDKTTKKYTDVGLQLELNKTIAIHLHLYYEDLAQEFYGYLSNIPYVFDLYVSIRKGVSVNKIKRIFKDIANLNYIEVKVSENSGRDFGPMFVLFADKLKKYDYIMHIHSKKSLRSGNEQVEWRHYLLDNLLGNPELIMRYFYLMENCNSGLAYPDAYETLAFPSYTWLSEKNLAQKIMQQIGVEYKDEILEFSAGSMFWAKTDALRQLLDLKLTWDDFGKDKKQVGGTLEYVFERILGTLARHNNYNISILNVEKGLFYLNNGNKSLDRYALLNQYNAVQSVGNADVVSFAIFDTLITRKINNPEDIFLLIQKKLETIEIDLKDYVTLRKKAYLELKSKKDFECTLDEIYDEFQKISGLTKEKAKEIEEIEIQTELDLCVPKREVLNMFNEIKKTGKKIILISDTYLSKDTIEKMLEKCGYFGYDELWLSSETKTQKSTGKMWKEFFDKYGDKQTFHFGNDEVSDIHMLADMGKVVFYLATSKRLLQLSNYNIEEKDFDLANSVLFGCVYNKSLFNTPFALYDFEKDSLVKTFADFGYSIIGPAILNCMLKLINSLKNEDNKIILFDSSNSTYMRKIFDHLIKKLEIENENEEYDFLISNNFVLAMEAKNKEELLKLFDKNYKGTLMEILYYTIGFRELNFENKIIELPNDIKEVEKIIDDNYDLITCQIKHDKENYLKYIKSLSGNFEKKDIKFISFEGEEDKEKFLAKIFNKKITKISMDIQDEYKILLKAFLGSTQRILEYVDDDLHLQYTLCSPAKQEYLEQIYKGIIELIDDVINIYGKDFIDAKLNEKVIESNLNSFKEEINKLPESMKVIFDVEKIDEI